MATSDLTSTRFDADPGAGLAARMQAGDATAFESAVRQFGGLLLTVARRVLDNEQDAQEAVQDAFLCAFRGIGGYDGAARFSTWLYRIGMNAALMKLRSRRRKPERLIADLLPSFLPDGHQTEPAAAWAECASDAAARRETQQLVREAIAQLPEPYRVVLLMRDIEEHDTHATAEALGVTEGVVKTRLHRARLALRTLLDARFRGATA